jgi:glyoxylase-like metal-dependent hydrolase (beta-lactamase superfamily II)
MNVERLNVGYFTSAAGIWRRGDDMETQVRFPIPAYLIADDEHRILVDTGLNPDAIADPVAHYEDPALAMFKFEQNASIADQIDLSTLTGVVLTHLHFDHAGGLTLVPDSVPVYLQRREWDATQDKETKERNFFHPRDYAPIGDRVTLVDGDHDLLGDGSIQLLSTPGHTPGHQSVRVGEELVIGGDVVHYASGLDDHRFPLFADDHEAQEASAERLRELRDQGLEVTPGHDPELLP